MKLIILDQEDLVGEWAAKYLIKRIKDFNPNADKYFVLGLPTGNLIDLLKLQTLQNIEVNFKYRKYTFENVCQACGISQSWPGQLQVCENVQHG